MDSVVIRSNKENQTRVATMHYGRGATLTLFLDSLLEQHITTKCAQLVCKYMH